MEQRSQDFQERARRQELTDRELCGIGLNLGKDDLTTAGDLLYLVLDSERKNFESIALADQILKDRRYLIAKDYFLELAEGTFQTWRDLLYTNEGYSLTFMKESTYLPGRCGTTVISRQILLLTTSVLT
jgi:hypothetical protein